MAYYGVMVDTDINNVMASIVGNLMPICAREADPELWLIYDQMQKWALMAEHKLPAPKKNEPAHTAKTIVCHLGNLRNRKLARDIERIVRRHTPELSAAH